MCTGQRTATVPPNGHSRNLLRIIARSSRQCAAGSVQPFSQSSFSQHFSDKLSLGAPSLPVSGLDSFGIGALAGGFSQDSFVDQQVWSLSPAHAMRCSQCDYDCSCRPTPQGFVLTERLRDMA